MINIYAYIVFIYCKSKIILVNRNLKSLKNFIVFMYSKLIIKVCLGRKILPKFDTKILTYILRSLNIIFILIILLSKLLIFN